MVHHEFRKGQKVLVILKNGEQIVDKYKESKGQFLKLENNDIRWENIRSSTIYNNKGR